MKQKKRLRRLACLLLCLGLLPMWGCGDKDTEPTPAQSMTAKESPATIVVASDLHYLSPKLTDGGEAFRDVVEHSDGKLMLYIEELTDAFLDEVIALQPDALVLSGDLTFNGEYESHKALVKKLRRVQEAGIAVLALPGNHDLNNSQAARFSGEHSKSAKSIEWKDFRELYEAFGRENALAKDRNSCSYVFSLRQDLRVLVLDTNSRESNAVPKATLSWVRKQLKKAQKAGARVITVSHQNVLTHNAMFTVDYRLENAKELLALYQQYAVLCNLSGHMHLQHIAEQDGVTEILTSALSLAPDQYGVVEYDGAALDYHAAAVDVESWAQKTGAQDENLLHFRDYGKEFALESAREQILDFCRQQNVADADAAQMAECFAQMNFAYFSGRSVETAEYSRSLQLWESQRGSMYASYLQTMLQEFEKGKDHLHCTIPVTPAETK